MLSTSPFVLWVCFVSACYFHDVTTASYLQDFSSWDYTRRPSTGDKTFSEERLERKESGMFGWTTALHPDMSRKGNQEQRSTSETTFITPSRPRPSHLDIGDYTTRRPSTGDKTFSEERLERKEIGMFGSTTALYPDVSRKGNQEQRSTSETTFLTPSRPRPSHLDRGCKEFEKGCLSRERAGKSTDLEMRITGGRMAEPKKNTFMVLIGYGTKSDRQWLCGGSLVSERFVLTAAHCTEGGTLGKAKWVRVGELDLSTRKDDARPQDKDIVEWIQHREYKEPAVYNDIALLKLESDVTFNEWVSPICLHTSSSLPSSPVTVAGWGRLDFASNTSPMLLEVEINLFNDTECMRLMGNMNHKMQMPRGVDTDTMICAGEIRGGKDACSGDSGGPLFYEGKECVATQVGITSLGKDCGLPNTAGIYTNVNKYISWIESIVWPEED